MVEDSVTLIRVKSRPDTGAETWTDVPFEPAFFDPGTKLLPELPSRAWRDRYAAHLGFHVAGKNRDLLAHVRRILLWTAAGNRQATYLAIADLFQVLGSKGVDLRRDMLRRVKSVLSPIQISNLNSQLAATQSVALVLDLPTSRFSTKRSADLVMKKDASNHARAGNAGPLIEARDFLETGQVDQARHILETALPDNANDAEMNRELLEIYRRARDLKGCEAMHSKLAHTDGEIDRAWTDTITMLRTGELDFQPRTVT